MNCQELRNSINRLKSQRDSLQQKFNQMNETMQGKSEVKQLQESTKELEDQLLEQYKENFAEKNSWLFRWQFREIDQGYGDKDVWVVPPTIHSIASLPDGDILVGSDEGHLDEYRKDDNGEWKLEKKIIGFGNKSNLRDIESVHSIVPLPDGNMLIGGSQGTLCECTRNNDGEWQLGKKINSKLFGINSITALPDGGMIAGGEYGCLSELRKVNGEWQEIESFQASEFDINSIIVLPDDSILAGGEEGSLYVFKKDKKNKWLENEIIYGHSFYGYEDPPDFYSIAPLPDGDIIIGGSNGSLYRCSKNKNGQWFLTEEIKGLIVGRTAKSIVPLSNDSGMLIGEHQGWLYEYKKGKDNNWRLGKIGELEAIPEFNKNPDETIECITSLPDGSLLIGGQNGCFFEATKPTPTPEFIRKNIKKIIEK